MDAKISGIEFEIVRKDMKTLRLAVLPPDGHVRVSAPKRLPTEQIFAFVQSKTDWILKQQARIAQRPQAAQPQYLSGETLPLWGKPCLLRVEQGKSGLQLIDGTVLLTAPGSSTAQSRGRLVNEWYRAMLKAEIEARLPLWEAKTGLYCSGWQIKNMTTRWGTCNTATRKIWLNLQLAKFPPECLDCVLVHELAHLRVHNHSAEFWALMDVCLPDWREIHARLNGKT